MQKYLKYYEKLLKFYIKNNKFPSQKEIMIFGCCDEIECDKFKNLFNFKNKLDNSINLVVAHCIQPSESQELELEHLIKKKFKNEFNENNYGINSQCDNRIWRIDVSMSRAFDSTIDDSEFFNKFKNEDIKKKCKQWKLKKRRPQVLHIKPDNSFEILECTYKGVPYDLDRINDFDKLYNDCINYRSDKLDRLLIYN